MHNTLSLHANIHNIFSFLPFIILATAHDSCRVLRDSKLLKFALNDGLEVCDFRENALYENLLTVLTWRLNRNVIVIEALPSRLDIGW